MVHTEIIKPHYVLSFEVKYIAIPATVFLTVYTAFHPQPVSNWMPSKECVLLSQWVKVFCVSMEDRTPVSHIPGERQNH